MKPLLHLLVCAYPRRWRERYGAELHALIDDLSPGWREVVDVVTGGIVMRMRMSNVPLTAAWCGIIGAVVGGVGAFAAPARFESRGTMTALVVPATADPAVATRRLQAAFDTAVDSAFGSDNAPRAAIAVTRTATANEIEVAYTDRDPRRAQEMAELLFARTIEANLTLGETSRERSSGVQLKVNTPPNLPESPSRQYVVPLVGGGVGAGALLGAVVAFVRRRGERN